MHPLGSDARSPSHDVHSSPLLLPLCAAATIAAERAAAVAEERLLMGSDGPPELDEFGRNINMQREREARERG